MSQPPTIDPAVPAADREQFVRDNAVALVRQLEEKSDRQRQANRSLLNSKRMLRKFGRMQGAEIARLKKRVAELEAALEWAVLTAESEGRKWEADGPEGIPAALSLFIVAAAIRAHANGLVAGPAT